MKEFIEKLIGMLEEISVENTCSDCPYKAKCDEVQEHINDETTDLCGATIKALSIEIVNQLAEEYNNESVNGDLISRSATIKALEEGAFVPDWNLALAQAIVSKQPTACNDGWIPCGERLPNESERWLGHDIIDAEPREFIVMVKGAYEPTTGYYTVDGWVKDIYNKEEYGYADEIIAWMPLPEPFKPIAE